MVHGVERLLGDSVSLEPRRGCTFWSELAEPHDELRYIARDPDGALALWSYAVR